MLTTKDIDLDKLPFIHGNVFKEGTDIHELAFINKKLFKHDANYTRGGKLKYCRNIEYNGGKVYMYIKGQPVKLVYEKGVIRNENCI